jgi:hypothetical protein
MLAVDQSTKIPPIWSTALSLIHHSTISVQHAKEGYDDPTIHLPHTLSKLAGLPTRIYKTLHDGALAFLVVIELSNSASENAAESAESSIMLTLAIAY